MIVTTTRHGRTGRDVRQLAAHLGRGEEARVVLVGGVPLSNADDALRYMEALRDGSRATVAMHHVTLSPAADLTDAQRDRMVSAVLAAMGAEDHAHVLWEHSKERSEPGGSLRHWHLVVGHVGPDGRALDDGHSYARLEAAARVLEADWGHALTPSRRAAAVAAALDATRPDVAAAVRAAQPPEPPRSATGSAARAAAARQGIDLPAAQAAVRAAWSASDSPAAFRSALALDGLQVASGSRSGVWVVRAGGVDVGALDRIVREKRAAVGARMQEVQHVEPEAGPGSDARQDSGNGNQGRPDRDPGPGRGDGPPAVARAPGRAGGRPAQPDRGAEAAPRGGPPESAPAPPLGDGRERPRRCPRRAAEAVAVHRLRRVASPRLTALAAELRALAAEPVTRAVADLDRREREARDRFAATPRDLPEPSALARAREREYEAREASHAAFYGWLDVERRARAACERPEPRGLWSILTGQRVEWRREVDEARATLAAIDARRADARKAAADAAAVFGPLDRLYRADAEAARRRHAIEERRTADELALFGAARRVLATEPALASGTADALFDAARRRLADEARAAEEAERWRQAREDRERDRLIESRRVRLPPPEPESDEYRGPRR